MPRPLAVLCAKKKKVNFFFYLSVFILGDFLEPLEIYLLSKWKTRCVFYIFNRCTCSRLSYYLETERQKCLQGTDEPFGVDHTAQTVTVPRALTVPFSSGLSVTALENS